MNPARYTTVTLIARLVRTLQSRKSRRLPFWIVEMNPAMACFA